MDTKDGDQPRVFDVAKPGQSEPSSTSRPVIVGHKNMIDDPMMKAAASSTLDANKPPEEGSSITVREVTDDDSIAPHQAKPVMPLEKIDVPKDEPAEAEKPAEPPAAPEPAKEPPAGDSVSDAMKAKEKDEKANQEEQAEAEAIQKLIESKQYVVHVGEINHHKRSRLMYIIVIVAVLAAAGATAAYLLK